MKRAQSEPEASFPEGEPPVALTELKNAHHLLIHHYIHILKEVSKLRPLGGHGYWQEFVASRNHQRIDRPLLPERPPSGRLVSGRRGQAGGRWPCRSLRRSEARTGCPAAYRTPATSVDTGDPCGSHRRHATSCGRSGPGPGPGPLRPQATAVLVPVCGPELSQAGARTVAGFRSAVAGLSAVVSAAGCGRVRRGRPDGCRGARCPRCWRGCGRCPDGWCPPRTLPQSAGVRCYRKWSPDRRPPVGCSHRRQARRSCRASRSRSCLRT